MVLIFALCIDSIGIILCTQIRIFSYAKAWKTSKKIHVIKLGEVENTFIPPRMYHQSLISMWKSMLMHKSLAVWTIFRYLHAHAHASQSVKRETSSADFIEADWRHCSMWGHQRNWFPARSIQELCINKFNSNFPSSNYSKWLKCVKWVS